MNRFHCHRVPDSFQLKVFGFVEVRRGPLDCPELHWFVRYRACFLGGWDSGDFPGLCKKTPARNHPLVWYGTTWDSRRAYLSFVYFCRYRFELVLLLVFMDDGSYWSTMVSAGLDLILHRWSAGTNCARVSGRGLLLHESPDEPSSSEMDDLLFYHQQHLAWSSWTGLDFPVRGIPVPLSS